MRTERSKAHFSGRQIGRTIFCLKTRGPLNLRNHFFFVAIWHHNSPRMIAYWVRGYLDDMLTVVISSGSENFCACALSLYRLRTTESSLYHVCITILFKNLFILSVRIASYGCTREGWRARKMRKSCTRR